MPEERVEGTVKSYDAERGFGWIARPGQQDAHVHRSEVQRARLQGLNQGDRVSFVVQQGDRGPRATNLQLLGKAQAAAPAAATRPDTSTTFRFSPDYLKDGYFEAREDECYLRPEVLDSLAMNVAKVLGNREMKSHQLRRFFNKARGIETKINREGFERGKEDIYSFKRDVAYQVGRRVVPEEFKQFIDRNVDLAVRDEKSFRKGFLQHFESVLAYFVYYFREE